MLQYAVPCYATGISKHPRPIANCSLNLLPWTAKWLVVPAHELQECSITSYLDLQWWHIIPSEHSSAASYNVSPKTVSPCKSLLMYISRKNPLSSFWKWKREHLGNVSWLFLYFPANNPTYPCKWWCETCTWLGMPELQVQASCGKPCSPRPAAVLPSKKFPKPTNIRRNINLLWSGGDIMMLWTVVACFLYPITMMSDTEKKSYQ